MGWFTNEEVRARVDRLEIDFNRYGVDRYGSSKKDLVSMYSIMAWMYRKYFQVNVHGIEHVPKRGRAMLVGNHSGGLALDGAIVSGSMLLEAEPPRLVQAMVDKFVGRIPFGSLLFGRMGHLLGLPEHAERLLQDERLLMVFPEGHNGTAKLYGDRHSLVRFGTGFMRLALKTKSPIVPFAFLGGGEAIPTVANLEKTGRLLGMPYLPVTPYLLPIPMRVPLDLFYSEPMTFEGSGNEEDRVINGYVDEVKSRIAELIERGVRMRRGRGEASFQ